MGSVSPAQVSDGTTIDASDVNNPINTIANEFNGNIDNTNIKAAAAIAGSKLADNSIDITTKASSWDGWVQVTDTWTYASATTVTVPSDATTKYSVGDKVKFTNSGSKYFYITAVSATVLTLNGGSDYTVANAAISAVYYSKAATPLSFPQWFTWSPTWTNVTVGNGTVSAKFIMLGKAVIFRCSLVFGSTTSISATPQFSLPITSVALVDSAGVETMGTAKYSDAGTAQYVASLKQNSTTKAQIDATGVSGALVRDDSVTNATAPFTWTTNDAIHTRGTYEAA